MEEEQAHLCALGRVITHKRRENHTYSPYDDSDVIITWKYDEFIGAEADAERSLNPKYCLEIKILKCCHC